MPEGDWTVIGNYNASSSVVNATLVYKPFNLATPIAGLQSYDWEKKNVLVVVFERHAWPFTEELEG